MKTVSFDFDFTLWDEDQSSFIWETVALLRKHIRDGDRVIITTSRVEKWIPEVHSLLAKLGLNIEVFSAPSGKSPVLLAQGVDLHFDDLADDTSFDEAKKEGIEVILPPSTKATVSSMY